MHISEVPNCQMLAANILVKTISDDTGISKSEVYRSCKICLFVENLRYFYLIDRVRGSLLSRQSGRNKYIIN